MMKMCCSVCGYAAGSTAPDVCPVCRKSGTFSMQDVPDPVYKKPACLYCPKCGYISVRPPAPTSCPVCGEPGSSFKLGTLTATPGYEE